MTIRNQVAGAALFAALGSLGALTAAAPLAGQPLGQGAMPPLLAPPPLPVASPAPRPWGRRLATAAPTTPEASGLARGQRLRIQGVEQRASWEGGSSTGSSLWLPLEVLQGQLGVSSRPLLDGALSLEWYGQRLMVPAAEQRSLADEVAVDAAPLLDAVGVQRQLRAGVLELELPTPQLLRIR